MTQHEQQRGCFPAGRASPSGTGCPATAAAAARYRPQPGAPRVRRPVAAAHPRRLLRRAAAGRGPGRGRSAGLGRARAGGCRGAGGRPAGHPAVPPGPRRQWRQQQVPKTPAGRPGGSATITAAAGAPIAAGKMPRTDLGTVLKFGHGQTDATTLPSASRSRCRAGPAPLSRCPRPGQGTAPHLPLPRRVPLYERFRGEVRRLQKDPDPGVRAAALHVERDACQIETIEAGLDRAAEQGWRYSDAGWVSMHRQRQATDHWLPR